MRDAGEFLGKLSGGCSRIHRKNPGTTVIAVLGSDRGVGATHFCMALCNFLQNVYGLKVSYAEMNMHSVAGVLEDKLENRVRKIRMYGCGSLDWNSIRKGSDAAVADISWDNPGGMAEFMRSDIRFVVGALSSWKEASLESMLDRLLNTPEGNCDFTCLSLPCDRRIKKKIEKEYGIAVSLIPYMENPFILRSEHCMWFERLLSVYR